jgi:chromosome segregation ATPase
MSAQRDARDAGDAPRAGPVTTELLAEIERLEVDNADLRARASRLREAIDALAGASRTEEEQAARLSDGVRKVEALRREAAALRDKLDARERQLLARYHEWRNRSPFDELIALFGRLFGGGR